VRVGNVGGAVLALSVAAGGTGRGLAVREGDVFDAQECGEAWTR
jgi:hypothetical protein